MHLDITYEYFFILISNYCIQIDKIYLYFQELKEACKSIEKVLVQNIHFGLSIPLTQALESIDRWRFVQSALPHVMHCAAALLHNRYAK